MIGYRSSIVVDFMPTNDIILVITSLLGTGGLGALLTFMAQRHTTVAAHDQQMNESRNQDERTFRRDLMKELEAREAKYQTALDKTDLRIAGLQATIDGLDSKYRLLATDYTTLSERNASQAHHIQNVTALTLDRDYWRRQATIFKDAITELESRIGHLETELSRIGKDT